MKLFGGAFRRRKTIKTRNFLLPFAPCPKCSAPLSPVCRGPPLLLSPRPLSFPCPRRHCLCHSADVDLKVLPRKIIASLSIRCRIKLFPIACTLIRDLCAQRRSSQQAHHNDVHSLYRLFSGEEKREFRSNRIKHRAGVVAAAPGSDLHSVKSDRIGITLCRIGLFLLIKQKLQAYVELLTRGYHPARGHMYSTIIENGAFIFTPLESPNPIDKAGDDVRDPRTG